MEYAALVYCKVRYWISISYVCMLVFQTRSLSLSAWRWSVFEILGFVSNLVRILSTHPSHALWGQKSGILHSMSKNHFLENIWLILSCMKEPCWLSVGAPVVRFPQVNFKTPLLPQCPCQNASWQKVLVFLFSWGLLLLFLKDHVPKSH